MKITLRTIPHKDQRYDTVGDWATKNNTIKVKVSELHDDRYNFLVAVHEILEAGLCKFRGITTEQVDKWDMAYQGPSDEPGADPDCPYHQEHIFATAVEKALAVQLGCDWDSYEKAIEGLK